MAKQVKVKKNTSEYRVFEEKDGQFKYIGARRYEKLWEIGLVASQISKIALRKKSPLFVRLSMEWENFIGPSLAPMTQPAKLHQGTLTVACQGPAAMELQYVIPQLLQRLNESCGLQGEYRLKRIKILQSDIRSRMDKSQLKETSSVTEFLPPSDFSHREKLEKELETLESPALKAAFSKLLLSKS